MGSDSKCLSGSINGVINTIEPSDKGVIGFCRHTGSHRHLSVRIISCSIRWHCAPRIAIAGIRYSEYIFFAGCCNNDIARYIRTGDGYNTRAVVVIVVPQKNADEINDMLNPYGVLVISRPINRHLFHHYLQFSDCFRARILNIQHENEELRTMVEDLKIVDRAKLLLVTCLNMSEDQAHRYLEKQAMDMRISRVEVAKQVIKTYQN